MERFWILVIMGLLAAFLAICFEPRKRLCTFFLVVTVAICIGLIIQVTQMPEPPVTRNLGGIAQ